MPRFIAGLTALGRMSYAMTTFDNSSASSRFLTSYVSLASDGMATSFEPAIILHARLSSTSTFHGSDL
ncbi:hypothetical protein LOAG_11167 [Loa loa]|uniref:Uncharacterized protein n=1 Tax=Loa loa TaxID=7209 RepID=A0A1S0TND3_LOALO|nr:hypothetical protein LOAG_11167 [Loa loa]EFO17331.1 hypothetical protein LOAG_11167 [Loa loa]